MDWLCHIVGVFLGSLLARLNAPFLKAAPLLFLTVTLAVTHSASAAWNQAASPASGSLGALEPCAGFDAFASRCRIGQSVFSLYGLASDDAVAARAGATVFKTGHYAERLAKEGVDVVRAEKAVAERIGAMRPNMSTGAEVRGRSELDGVLLEYRAYPLPNGSVNVGTIFPVTP